MRGMTSSDWILASHLRLGLHWTSRLCTLSFSRFRLQIRLLGESSWSLDWKLVGLRSRPESCPLRRGLLVSEAGERCEALMLSVAYRFFLVLLEEMVLRAFGGNVGLWQREGKVEVYNERGAMVRRTGARWSGEVRLRLWVVVAVVASSTLRLRVAAQVGGEYSNRSFPAESSGNISSYDQTIQQAAYSAFARLSPVTGIMYNASLTGDLANVTVVAVRLRVGSLRRYGVTLGRFTIPPGLRMTNVSSVRVILVYRDFGNVSVYSSSVPGQVFVSSLAGIRVYNGDTLRTTAPLPALTAIALDNPIQVIIPPNAQPSYCVEFYMNGTVLATNASATNASATNASATNTSPTHASSPSYACFSRTLGDNYFALVGSPPSGKKSNAWKVIVGIVVGGVGLIMLLSLLILCCRRHLRKRKIAKMQSQVDRGETLQPTVVGNSKAPMATQTRTRPMLEKDFNVS